jgi:multimeric flavodoxin WrbA
MKAIAFNGSPRKRGNTEIMLQRVLTEIEATGIETELIQIGGEPLRGCTACMQCRDRQDRRCTIEDDRMNAYIEKAFEADIILLGSPTYFADVSTEMKALIDRLGFVGLANGGCLRNKIGAAVVAVRRGGGTHVFDSMNHLFQISGMFVVGSTYWNLGFGLGKGEVRDDEEGMNNMADLGKRIAWLAGKIAGQE